MIKRIVFDNFDDFVYYDDSVNAFYDARGTEIIQFNEDVDEEFIESLKKSETGHEALSFLLVSCGYSIGETAEDVLLDYYENDYSEASFGDVYAQAEIDQLEEDINTMSEEALIYTYRLVKIGESIAKVGE